MKTNIVQWKVFFYFKFRILGDYKDMSGTCLMSCPVSSNFTGYDIGWSQLSTGTVAFFAIPVESGSVLYSQADAIQFKFWCHCTHHCAMSERDQGRYGKLGMLVVDTP